MTDSNYKQCDRCDKFDYDLIESVYGDKLCRDCWDDYINSNRGKAEYFVSYCRNYRSLDELLGYEDSDFVGACFEVYKANTNIIKPEVITEVTSSTVYKDLISK